MKLDPNIASLRLKAAPRFQLPPEGTTLVQAFSLFDLGSHHTQWGLRHNIRTGFLTLDERMSDGRPFAVNRTLSLSYFDGSVCYEMITALLGRSLSDDEVQNGVQLGDLIGRVCLAEIAHVKRGDRTYANITAFMKAPKGTAVPELEIEPTVFIMGDNGIDDLILDTLPEWAQTVIKASVEYEAMEAAADGENGDDEPHAMRDELKATVDTKTKSQTKPQTKPQTKSQPESKPKPKGGIERKLPPKQSRRRTEDELDDELPI
jgi:hypothetical protein